MFCAKRYCSAESGTLRWRNAERRTVLAACESIRPLKHVCLFFLLGLLPTSRGAWWRPPKCGGRGSPPSPSADSPGRCASCCPYAAAQSR
eukprot:1579975-Pyramimonas_sp.AAC.1